MVAHLTTELCSAGAAAAAANASVTLHATPAIGIHTSTRKLGRGAYLLLINATRSGSYNMGVLATGSQRTSFQADVASGPAHGPSSQVLTSNGTAMPRKLSVRAGSEVVAYVQQMDRFGNQVPLQNANLSGFLTAGTQPSEIVPSIRVTQIASDFATHRYAWADGNSLPGE